MSRIEFKDGAFEIDASILAHSFGLEPSRVPDLLRAGAITSRCERGIGEDEGHYRLTFFHEGQRLRIVVNEAGQVLQRSSIDFGELPLPASLRSPGG